MATQLQIRRGTAAQVAAFTGAEGEIVYNSTNDSLHTNDGATAGGFELARADLNNVLDADLNAALTGNTLSALTITNLTAGAATFSGEIAANGGIALGDNDKAIFGAGSDLQIYHNGSYSAITDVGTGAFYIGGADFVDIGNSTLSETSARFYVNDRVDLYYDNAVKLSTTSTGIDVTGAATFSGAAVVRSGNTLTLNRTDNAIGGAMSYVAGTGFIFNDANGDGTSFNVGAANRLRIDGASGNVGIGTSSPASGLELEGVGNATNITLDNITASTGRSYSIRSGNTGNLDFYDNDVTSARMAINASGVLGVGVVPYTQWRTDYKALQIGVSGALWSSINNNNTLLSNNTAANANGSRYRLVAGAAAELYLTGTGTFDFRSSPTSGAVSSIISDMTTKMTLDSSGTLLLASSANWNSAGTIGSLITGPHYTRLPTANGLYWLSSVNTSNQYIVQNNASNGVYIAYGATSWSSTSDERLKDIIEPITDGLEKVATLRTVIGKYKTDEEEVRRPFLMAQDVFEVLPEAVDQSNPDAWGLSTHDLTPLLVSALKDAKNLIEALTARIEALEGA